MTLAASVAHTVAFSAPAARPSGARRAAVARRSARPAAGFLLAALVAQGLPGAAHAADGSTSTSPALVVSASPSRTSPVPLDGATAPAKAHVFVTPASAVRRVDFRVTDATRARGPYRTERHAPFDLRGGTDDRADALDTTTLAPGRHTVTAKVTLKSGSTRTLTGSFLVAQPAAATTTTPDPTATTPTSAPETTTPTTTTPETATTTTPTTTNTPTVPAVPPLRIAPVSSGTRDGSSWANAGSLADLPRFVAARPTGGEIWLRGDAGPYVVTGSVAVRSGGATGAPVVVRGVDASGGTSARPLFVGNRTSPYSATGVQGPTVFRLHTGAKNLVFRDLSFKDQGAAFAGVGSATGITVTDMTAVNVRRFFDNVLATGETAADLRDLTIRRVRVDGFSRSFLRVQYASSGVLVEDVVADSQRQDGDDFAMGVHLDGTANHIVLRRVTMANSHSSSGTYWNGDGFVAEKGVSDVRFESTTATGSTDGGYDLKSSRTVLVDAQARDNGRNFRFWAKDTTVEGCRGDAPRIRGGSSNQNQVWLASGAAVRLVDCPLADLSDLTKVFELGTDATATMVGGSISRSAGSALATTRTGSRLVLQGVVQTVS